MKQKLIIPAVLLFCLFLSAPCFGQLMEVNSKDSLNGKPRLSSALIGRLVLHGYYNIAGTLGDFSNFVINATDITGKDIRSFNMDMRPSQLRFRSTMQLKNGKEFTSLLEADFIGANNTSQFRLRQAWVQYDHWMLGQNWSTFGSGALWPASLLDDGPTGMVLSRRMQVRYTGRQTKSFPLTVEVSAEYTELRRLYDYTLDPAYGVDFAPSRFPDGVLGISRFFNNGGFVKLAGMYRSIEYNSKNITTNQPEFSYAAKPGGGVTVLTSIFFNHSVGINNLQAQWSFGKGIADYFVALGGFGLDGFPNSNATGELILLPVHGGFISYQKYWTKKFHTMAVASYNRFYDAGETISGWNKMNNYYLVVNVGYDFFKFLMLAIEPQVGYKEFEFNDGSRQGANAVRIGFGMLYNF